jgi:hypothetical protein
MSLPAWVWVPATRLKTHWLTAGGDTGLVGVPRVRLDRCTRTAPSACAVVYAKQDIADDTFLTERQRLSACGEHDFYTLYAGMAKRALGSNGGTQRRAAAPGLIEVAITIALTGPNPRTSRSP